MLRTRVKTKFQGKVWVHQRYITALEEGGSLVIEHERKLMTISPSFYKENPPTKSVESFQEQYGKDKGKRYHLYGFVFKADDNQAVAKAQSKTGDLLAQCSKCGAIKILDTKNKTYWQQSIVKFPNLPEEVCPVCGAP